MTTPLRQFRSDHNLTLTQLGERVGLGESQMSRVEREGTDMLPVAIKLSEITGLPVETFAKSRAV